MFSRLKSIAGFKCPKCSVGDLFPNNDFFDFKFQVNKSCPHCKEDFVREPGFYYGAMFLSYIISAFFSLAVCGICIIGFNIEWRLSIVILIAILAILFVYLFRFSRSLWLHLMVKGK
ncbi:MAG: DUF983 domain-containing protein [Saprospiraceae bacterium]|nr:DUF983 domain-containing protein [Saprospiraceae bacterium]MBK9993169.1 DUF983 domain-containing protein [Saprospiraceae bacterium]